MNATQNYWRKCSTCKKEISFGAIYFECNVSTCTGLRTGYVFCGISCWEVHLPGAKHRNAGAVEKKSPTSAHLSQEANQPKRIIISNSQANMSQAVSATKKSTMSSEVLVVVSKMKQYIRDLSEMNTSEDVNQIISDIIRNECEKAITKAKSDGRKTVMARDFK